MANNSLLNIFSGQTVASADPLKLSEALNRFAKTQQVVQKTQESVTQQAALRTQEFNQTQTALEDTAQNVQSEIAARRNQLQNAGTLDEIKNLFTGELDQAQNELNILQDTQSQVGLTEKTNAAQFQRDLTEMQDKLRQATNQLASETNHLNVVEKQYNLDLKAHQASLVPIAEKVSSMSLPQLKQLQKEIRTKSVEDLPTSLASLVSKEIQSRQGQELKQNQIDASAKEANKGKETDFEFMAKQLPSGILQDAFQKIQRGEATGLDVPDGFILNEFASRQKKLSEATQLLAQEDIVSFNTVGEMARVKAGVDALARSGLITNDIYTGEGEGFGAVDLSKVPPELIAVFGKLKAAANMTIGPGTAKARAKIYKSVADEIDKVINAQIDKVADKDAKPAAKEYFTTGKVSTSNTTALPVGADYLQNISSSGLSYGNFVSSGVVQELADLFVKNKLQITGTDLAKSGGFVDVKQPDGTIKKKPSPIAILAKGQPGVDLRAIQQKAIEDYVKAHGKLPQRVIESNAITQTVNIALAQTEALAGTTGIFTDKDGKLLPSILDENGDIVLGKVADIALKNLGNDKAAIENFARVFEQKLRDAEALIAPGLADNSSFPKAALTSMLGMNQVANNYSFTVDRVADQMTRSLLSNVEGQ